MEAGRERRAAPRALVPAAAEVDSRAGRTEHVIYDLSTSGARLCGLPRAVPGESVALRLVLPNRPIEAGGRLVRVKAGQFAVQFTDLAAGDEEAIRQVVDAALRRPAHPAILLCGRADMSREWKWLRPVRSRCAVASTPLRTLCWLLADVIRLALVQRGDAELSARHLQGEFPEVQWRRIDSTGRLHDMDRF